MEVRNQTLTHIDDVFLEEANAFIKFNDLMILCPDLQIDFGTFELFQVGFRCFIMVLPNPFRRNSGSTAR